MESSLIRAALKKAGFTARQVSVRKGQGGYELVFYVTIRLSRIDKAEVEKIVRPFKSVDYDERTGGNCFIFVSYEA